MRFEGSTGIVVAPYWPTQVWYPSYMDMIISELVLIKKNKNILFSPYTNRDHPLSKKVTLMAAVLSWRH
jgi:hypothetical protein